MKTNYPRASIKMNNKTTTTNKKNKNSHNNRFQLEKIRNSIISNLIKSNKIKIRKIKKYKEIISLMQVIRIANNKIIVLKSNKATQM